MDLLTVLAEADHRGRVVAKGDDDTMTRVGLFPDFCADCEVWAGPRAFANDHSAPTTSARPANTRRCTCSTTPGVR
jgi:hypothetical protein